MEQSEDGAGVSPMAGGSENGTHPAAIQEVLTVAGTLDTTSTMTDPSRMSPVMPNTNLAESEHGLPSTPPLRQLCLDHNEVMEASYDSDGYNHPSFEGVLGEGALNRHEEPVPQEEPGG